MRTYITTLLFILLSSSLFAGVPSAETVSRSPDAIEENFWTPPVFTQQQPLGYAEQTFKTPPALENDVQFWVDIYSKYSTQQGVFHISGDTTRVLGEIDLSQVYANPKWSSIRKEKEADVIIRRQKKFIAQKYKIKDVKQIRLQMGLKDRMLEAINLSGQYLPMMEQEFRKHKIPIELTRIVFVESSFNIKAQSRVGASGLWQIMPNLGKKFKYMSDGQDLRNHPYYATRLAAKILKENYQILKSWPLAVTAYNHGVGSLRKIVKKYKSNDIAYLVDNVEAKRSFGFASRNFYATYLAALQVERNANLYFPEPIYKQKESSQKLFKLAKKLPFEKLLAIYDNDLQRLKAANPHLSSKFLKKGRILPAQLIVNLPNSQSARLASDLREITF